MFAVSLLTVLYGKKKKNILTCLLPGFYQMCFSNFHNRFGSMQISLSFGVYYDTYQDPSKSEEEEKKKEEISKELNNTLSVIEVHIATCCYSCYSVVVSVAVLTAVGEPKQVKCI